MVKKVVNANLQADTNDVEGHAFKWDISKDEKGRNRVRQTWNEDDGAAGTRQPTKSGIESRPWQGR